MTQTKAKSAKAKNPAKAPAGRVTKPNTKPPRKTKAALVREMLGRENGASLDDLCAATGWQPHTVRAALSGLRKAGHAIDRTKDSAGKSIYCIAATAETG